MTEETPFGKASKDINNMLNLLKKQDAESGIDSELYQNFPFVVDTKQDLSDYGASAGKEEYAAISECKLSPEERMKLYLKLVEK